MDVTKLFSNGKPSQLIWNTEGENNCFAVYEDYIDCLDFKKMALYPKIIEGAKGFGISGKWLYILEKNNQISKMTMDEKPRITLFKDSYPDKDLFTKSRFYNIEVLRNDILLFFGDGGDLVTMGPPQDVSCDGVVGFDFYKRNKQLLYWTKDTIWIADLNKEAAKDTFFFDELPLQKVYGSGTNISQCFWADDGTHVVFNDQGKVFLLELAQDGKHHVEYMTDVKNDSSIFYSDETGSLVYLNKAGNLMKLKIIVKENTPLIPLIEGEKGKEDNREL